MRKGRVVPFRYGPTGAAVPRGPPPGFETRLEDQGDEAVTEEDFECLEEHLESEELWPDYGSDPGEEFTSHNAQTNRIAASVKVLQQAPIHSGACDSLTGLRPFWDERGVQEAESAANTISSLGSATLRFKEVYPNYLALSSPTPSAPQAFSLHPSRHDRDLGIETGLVTPMGRVPGSPAPGHKPASTGEVGDLVEDGAKSRSAKPKSTRSQSAAPGGQAANFPSSPKSSRRPVLPAGSVAHRAASFQKTQQQEGDHLRLGSSGYGAEAPTWEWHVGQVGVGRHQGRDVSTCQPIHCGEYGKGQGQGQSSADTVAEETGPAIGCVSQICERRILLPGSHDLLSWESSDGRCIRPYGGDHRFQRDPQQEEI